MRDRNLENIKPYLDMMSDKVRLAVEGDKDIAGLRKLIKKRGFDLGLVVCFVIKVSDDKEKDAAFMKEMKIKYD